MSPVNQYGEIFHSAFSIGILEEHTANIISTEVHLMRELENGLHADVTKQHKCSYCNNMQNIFFHILVNWEINPKNVPTLLWFAQLR